MAEGFGQYVGVPPRMRELKRRIDEEGARDPEIGRASCRERV